MGGDDVEGGESDLDGAKQMGDLDHDEHVPWYTENMEDDDADDTACQDVDKESILSIMSVDEDVPTLDESSINLFLKKAMLGMQEVVQQGESAVAKGIKPTYAVKVGQKQSGQSERREKRKKQTEYEEGLQGGNQPENWFKKWTGVKADAAEDRMDKDIATGSSRSQAIELREKSESESEHDDETATLPPLMRAVSPAISSGREVGSESEPAIGPSHDQEFITQAQPSSNLLSPAAMHDDETATLPPSTRAVSPAISSGGEVGSESEPAIGPSHDREFVTKVQPSSDLLSPATIPDIHSVASTRRCH